MAVSLSFPFSSDTCYSCQLQELAVSSSEDSRVYFTAYYIDPDNHSARTLIFASTYATYHGTTTIHDIGTLLETYMQQNYLSAAQFVLSARHIPTSDVIEHTLWVVHFPQRKTDIPADQLLTDHFLTDRIQRITCRNAVERLPFFAPYGSAGGYTAYTYTVLATYRQPNGSIGTCTASVSGRSGYGVVSLSVSPKNIETHLRPQMPTDATLLSFVIRLDNRTATFYITDFTNCATFLYRNTYNCDEYLTLPLQLSEQITSKTSLARCSDSLQQYDTQHTRTYKAQTSLQTLNDARLFEEFLTSPLIHIVQGIRTYRILITDYTFDISDNPGTSNSVKFEFRFADIRQAMPLDEYSRIFSLEYTKPFV